MGIKTTWFQIRTFRDMRYILYISWKRDSDFIDLPLNLDLWYFQVLNIPSGKVRSNVPAPLISSIPI